MLHVLCEKSAQGTSGEFFIYVVKSLCKILMKYPSYIIVESLCKMPVESASDVVVGILCKDSIYIVGGRIGGKNGLYIAEGGHSICKCVIYGTGELHLLLAMGVNDTESDYSLLGTSRDLCIEIC